jgi:Mn2+/Fe2+ NRAMP family transporter
MQVYVPYQRYVQFLRWLTLALLAYVAVAFTVNVNWAVALGHAVWPQLPATPEVIVMIVAVFGTTISPYLFFWQASQEVADMSVDPKATALVDDPKGARRHLRRIRIDTYVGMGFSNLIAFFIILSTAVTLHTAGITQIETSAQAAQALRPIAGDLTFALFATGIIGTGLLAVPVLAGSAAYAMADAFGWNQGLERKYVEAKEFYAIIAFATIGGVLLDFTPLDPIKALFWSAVINGVIAVPIMAVMMLMAVRPEVMGPFVITRRLKFLGWLATGVMCAAVIAMFSTW